MTDSTFPVPTKKKLKVVIQESFEASELDQTDFLLSQLDPFEKNESDIVKAVNAHEAVPTPEVIRIDSAKSESLKSGAVFSAPDRCFLYDNQYFEPLTYYADEVDQQWVKNFNETHKFLRTSTRDVELVFEAIEITLRDTASNDPPSLDNVLHLINDDSPPFTVVNAIFEHWLERGRQNGSVIRYFEFPPEHDTLQQISTQIFRQLVKIRKGVNDVDYIKKLFKQLDSMNQERAKAIALLEDQKTKAKEDEQFLRSTMRNIKKKQGQSISFLNPPHNDNLPKMPSPPPSLNMSTIPKPPTAPAFLRWCRKQQQ